MTRIVAHLELSLGAAAGRASASSSGGITNRNFRVTFGGDDYVVRLPGKDTGLLGIDREAERLANDAAAALGFAPAVAATWRAGCDALPRCSSIARARSPRAPSRSRGTCAVPRLLGRLPTHFSVPELLDDYAAIVSARGGELPPAYAEAARVAARIFAALPLARPRPCHNDLLPGNVIREREGGRLMLVDWEYAGMGDRASTSATCPSATTSTRRPTSVCCAPTYGAARRTRARGAEADARALRRARSGLGRRAGRALRARLRLRRLRARALRAAADAAVRPRFQEWLRARRLMARPRELPPARVW